MPRDVPAPHAPHCVVVGAGFGGLAAAARARALGFRTTLLDRLPEPGGRARVLRQGKFAWDAGPTVITAPGLLAELFALFGERMEDHVALLPVRPWYRIRFADGRCFDHGGTAEEARAAVAAFAPDDVAGYERLMTQAKRLFETGFERYGAAPFHRPGAMMRALPALLRLGGYRSVSSLVRRHIRDEALARALSLQPLLVGGHPYSTPALYALILHLERLWGVWFPRGGTGALVAALTGLLQRHGVAWLPDRHVERIAVRNGRAAGVRLADGTTIDADAVIANADAAEVHATLLPADAPRVATARVDRMRYSFGLYVLCFGTDRTYPGVAHHTILLGRRWRALLDEVFGRGSALPDDPSLYLHRPAATDPAMAPAGCDAFYALVPVPNLRAGIDWAEAAPRLRLAVLRMLEERELPGLRSHIVAERSLAPPDFRRDYASRHGAGFSVAPTLLQSAWFRFHNRAPLPGLYLTGAGTHPGAGVPGVLTSAKLVEGLLRDDYAGALP